MVADVRIRGTTFTPLCIARDESCPQLEVHMLLRRPSKTPRQLEPGFRRSAWQAVIRPMGALRDVGVRLRQITFERLEYVVNAGPWFVPTTALHIGRAGQRRR